MRSSGSYEHLYTLSEALLRRSAHYRTVIMEVNHRIAKVNRRLLSKFISKKDNVFYPSFSQLFPAFSRDFTVQIHSGQSPVEHGIVNYGADITPVTDGESGPPGGGDSLFRSNDEKGKVIDEETNTGLPGAPADQYSTEEPEDGQDFPDKLTEKEKEAEEKVNTTDIELVTDLYGGLNTLLNDITVFSDSVSVVSDKKYLECVSNIRRSAETLLLRINDLSGFSSAQQGETGLPEPVFNLQEFFKGVIDSLLEKAVERNNSIMLIYDSNLPVSVDIDKGKLLQIMNTLISNAVKFSENSIVNVRVRKKCEENGTVKMYIEVQDHGIGMRPEAIKRLLEPFSNSDLLSEDDGGGIGRGLSLSKRLLCLMHGDLSVKSTFGLGSTFYFNLPIAVSSISEIKKTSSAIETRNKGVQSAQADVRRALNTDSDAIQSVPVNKTTDPIKKKHRILLAEDNEINQILTERLLHIQGYETIVVSNGVLALKKYETEEFDLLLIDIQMPEMDGMELIRRIREKEKTTNTHVPVLVLTAHVMPDDLRSFVESGADGCITKPVMMEQLRTSIEKALHGKT